MKQTIDEGRAQLIANLQQQAEELAQLNRIAMCLKIMMHISLAQCRAI